MLIKIVGRALAVLVISVLAVALYSDGLFLSGHAILLTGCVSLLIAIGMWLSAEDIRQWLEARRNNQAKSKQGRSG